MANTEVSEPEQRWRKANEGTDLTVPSGQTCRARRVDLRVLLKTGRIPNSLRPIIDKAMQGIETPTEDLAKGVLDDPTKMDEMWEMIDLVLVDSILIPKFLRAPVPVPEDDEGRPLPKDKRDRPKGATYEDERDPELNYVDEIDDFDKMYIFNWAVGGSSDLDKFREESAAHVGRVHAVAEGALSSLPPPGTE